MHRVDVVAGGVVVRALTHHVGAQRGVRHVRADVERARHALERVEVLGERLPVPLDALVERGAGDVLDALHQLDELLRAVGAHRREADAAVPEDRGGHAVPARRREVRVPGGLAVEVGVHVDEPGRDEQTVGVELATAPVRRRGRPRRRRRRRSRRRRCAPARRCRRRRCRHGSRGRASEVLAPRRRAGSRRTRRWGCGARGPPSHSTIWPVIHSTSCSARIACAMSSAVPSRPSGVRSCTDASQPDSVRRAPEHRRRGDAGAHRVDPDPVRRPLARRHLDQHAQRRLRRAVGAHRAVDQARAHARRGDDRSRRPGVDHRPGERAHHEQRPARVDRDHAVPLVHREVEEHARVADAGGDRDLGRRRRRARGSRRAAASTDAGSVTSHFTSYVPAMSHTTTSAPRARSGVGDRGADARGTARRRRAVGGVGLRHQVLIGR